MQNNESDIDPIVIKNTDMAPWIRAEEIDRYIPHNVPI